MKKKIISLILIIAILQGCICTTYAVSSAEADKLKAQSSNLKDEKKQVENKQNEVSNQISNVETEIQALDDKISSSEKEVAYYESKITDLNNSIDDKTKEIENKQDEIKENEELLQKRLVVLYEAGDTSFLDILVSSNGLIDFLSNYYMLAQLTQCDSDLISGIEKEKQTIEQDKTELEEQKTEANTVKEQKEAKSQELQSQKTTRQAKVSTLSKEKQNLQSDIDAYNAKIKEVDNAASIAIKKAMEEEDRKAREEAKKNNSNSGSSSSSSSTGSNGSSFNGTFGWPLDFSPRRVTSRMKERWGRWHKGIDIGTDGVTGKRVIASASGTVIYSAFQGGTSSSPGYGNYVIIYHGNGYASLYAHMSSKSVGMGQHVNQGDTVGYSGCTGGVAPHLHFEIRRATSTGNFFGNNWLNPLDYLPGGYTIAE